VSYGGKNPEGSNIKAPKGVNILLGPFFPTFKKFPFFKKTKYIFKKEVTMNTKIAVLIIVFLVFLTAHVANAQQPGKVPILGIWRLVSFEREYQATGEREYPMGKTPTGYILFLPEGRMAVVITGEGRKAPTTDQDRAGLFNSLVAYTGVYRVDGDKWITAVDVSANPAWVGTEQVRTFQISGDRLQEMTAWFARPDGRMARAVLTYERVK
jgi:hypothetical protein